MVMLKEKTTSKEKTVRKVDEFEKYLKEQRSKATCNGKELAAFSWYKEALGLS